MKWILDPRKSTTKATKQANSIRQGTAFCIRASPRKSYHITAARIPPRLSAKVRWSPHLDNPKVSKSWQKKSRKSTVPIQYPTLFAGYCCLSTFISFIYIHIVCLSWNSKSLFLMTFWPGSPSTSCSRRTKVRKQDFQSHHTFQVGPVWDRGMAWRRWSARQLNWHVTPCYKALNLALCYIIQKQILHVA